MAIHNIAAHLKPGGHFVGTIPDANVLARKLRNEPGSKMDFGNSVTSVRFEGDKKLFDKSNGPFGIKYSFFLADAIDDCPEYLIPFPTLFKMCHKAGLKLVEKRNFHKFFYRHVENPELRQLAGHMKVLTASEAGMSKDEWEACFYYCAFVFRKEGTPNPREAPPRGYVGGPQASRTQYEEDIVCFPGYGPNATEAPLPSPQPSPSVAPKDPPGHNPFLGSPVSARVASPQAPAKPTAPPRSQPGSVPGACSHCGDAFCSGYPNCA